MQKLGKKKNTLRVVGVVLVILASLWVVWLGVVVGSWLFVFMGGFYLVASFCGITMYLIKGETWPR